MKMKMMSKCFFLYQSHVFRILFYFLHFFRFKLFYFPLPIKEISNTKTVNNMSARE